MTVLPDLAPSLQLRLRTHQQHLVNTATWVVEHTWFHPTGGDIREDFLEAVAFAKEIDVKLTRMKDHSQQP